MITPNKEFWEVFKSTDGALSCTEAVAIMNIAAQAPSGTYVELGTYRGKSAMSAMLGLKDGWFYLVDPEFEKEEVCKAVFDVLPLERIAATFLINQYSTDFLPHQPQIAFCFVDSGSHQDGLPIQEVKLLEDRMVQGGIIAFHDWDSQFREVKEASDYLVSTGKYDYIPINWDEIIEYVNANNLEEGNKSWHHNELRNPCFVGAVRRK